MKIRSLLIQKRKAIHERWLSQILKTYPADAARFMSQNPNRFGNPVGHTYSREIEILFNALIDEVTTDEIDSALDEINKIRAVQDFNASQAVAYIFLLKTAVREELDAELSDTQVVKDLLSLESRIDGMALMAFDSFMRCREKLFEIKCKDIRRRASLFGGPDNKSSKHRS